MASRSWNRVELIGNLTRDPELRYTPNGAAVCTFGIATNRTYISEGEKKEEVDFHRAVAWNKLAELCKELLRKGIRVFVSGRLQNRSWETTDGTQRQTTEIVVEDMIILTPRSNGEVVVDKSELQAAAESVSLPGEDTSKKTDAPSSKQPDEAAASGIPSEATDSQKPKETAKKTSANLGQEDVDIDKDLPF